jgi:hypothetical protein
MQRSLLRCIFAAVVLAVPVARLMSQAPTPASEAKSMGTQPAGGSFTVNMTGPHFGLIMRDGKAVAAIAPDPSMATGERLFGMTGGNPPPEVLAFYESYKRGGTSSALATQAIGSSGSASWGKNGHTPTVQFNNDSKFGNDNVAWRKGHIEIRRDGDKIADLGYTGGGYGEGAAKRGLKIGLNEIGAAVTRNRTDDVLSTGWEVNTAKYSYNTSVAAANQAARGITQKNPTDLKRRLWPLPRFSSNRSTEALPILATISFGRRPALRPMPILRALQSRSRTH